MSWKSDLIDLFWKKNAIKRGEFTLSSGQKSDIYIDARLVTMDRTGAELISDMIQRTIVDNNWRPSSIGGPATGAIPIASTLLTNSFWFRSAFYTRNDPKSHGTMQIVEGLISEHPLLVDDVLTSGESLKKCILTLDLMMVTPVGVITILDRTGELRETILGVPYTPLLTLKELLDADPNKAG